MFIWKEKIRALQEKYKKYEDLQSFADAEEYQSLSFLDDYDICDETDGMFKHIHDNLMPCKTELSNLEEELSNLKRKFKTPKELLEQKHKSVWATKADNDNDSPPFDPRDHAVISGKLLDMGRVVTSVTRPRGQDSHRANEEDVRHMVCDTRGLTYTVHIPATVLELDMEEDFIHANDSVIVKVRDSVMTRVSLSWSQDNEVTIAGLGMLPRLGLTRKDLQPCIDRLERDDTGAEVELVGERAVELIRNRKRVLTRIVFTPQHSGVTGILLSWFAANLLRIF